MSDVTLAEQYRILSHDQLVHMLVCKEKTITQKDNQIGKLQAKVDDYEKVLRIVSLRSKLEGFVQKLYPRGKNKKTGETIYGKPEKLAVCDALSELVSSTDPRFVNDPFINMIRNRMVRFNLTANTFMKFSRWLYSQFSDKACHKMAAFSPPLPHYNDTDAIKEILKIVEIDTDDPAIICVQIMLEPLVLPASQP